jgi:DNA polymerase-3 subunit gamma/tau
MDEMGQALYRTYRSKKLSEVLGQEHITTALNHALEQGTISHAYLFTGPRGVGKTSTARILAYAINDLPYDEERQHLDIIEIDAASNRRIDEIRDLREKVHIAPSSAKYKVYIIDEVHMLTKEAFNALLKTLEEPPAHAVFILATTEAHKLPETIISRTQRYAFKPVDQNKVVSHLKHIAKQEKVTIDDDALALIAAHGEGSFRDSISLLDQVRNAKDKVTLEKVQTTLGIAPAELIETTLEGLQNHDSVAVAQTIRQMSEQGYEAAQIAKQLGVKLRASVIDGTNQLDHEVAMRLLGALVQVPASPSPAIALEIVLLDAALSGAPRAVKPSASKGGSPDPKVMQEEVQAPPKPAIHIDTKAEIKRTVQEVVAEPAAAEPAAPPAMTDKADTAADDATTADSDMILTEKAWEIILGALKKQYNTLYSIAKMAQPRFEPGKVTLEVAFPFHQKRMNEARNKQILSEIIIGVTGSDIQIVCIMGEGKPAPPPPPLPPADGETVHAVASALPTQTVAEKSSVGDVDAISNIFGGAELLES